MSRHLVDDVRRHATELANGPLAAAEKLREILFALVEAWADGIRLTPGDLADRVYKDEPEGSYDRTKQNVSKLRAKLTQYYKGLPDRPVLMLSVPNKRYTLEVATVACTQNPKVRRVWPKLAAASVVASMAFGAVLWSLADPSRIPRSRLDSEGRIQFNHPLGTDGVERWQQRLYQRLGFKASDLTNQRIEGFVWKGHSYVAGCTVFAGSCTLAVFDPSMTVVSRINLPILDGEPHRAKEVREMDGEVFPATYTVISAGPIESDGDSDTLEIAVGLRNQGYFPSPTMVFQTEPLRPSYVFWHGGYVKTAVLDIDADGTDEILLHGINNGNMKAALVRLDPTTGGYVQERSPEGWRNSVLEEVSHLPVGGLFLSVPPSVFDNPIFGPRFGHSASAVDVAWDGADGSLTVTVMDGVRRTTARDNEVDSRLHFEVVLDIESGIDGRLLNYGEYRRTFLSLIGKGQLDDRWGIVDSQGRLDAYRTELLGQLEFLDLDSGSWRPLEQEDIRLFLGPGRTR